MATAAVTALSYMELAGRYPVSASVSVYLHRAFGKRRLSTMIGLTMVGGGSHRRPLWRRVSRAI